MAEPSARPVRKFYTDDVEVAVWPFRGNEIYHAVTVHAFYRDRSGKRIETTQWSPDRLITLAHLVTRAADWVMDHSRLREEHGEMKGA